MILYFIPFERIGDFKINDSIENYKNRFEFNYIDDIDNIGAITYYLSDIELSLFVGKDTNLIESISCKEECLYKGRNIIKMSLQEFMIHSGEKYYSKPDCLDFEEDGIPQYVYEFEDVGLQVWVKEDIIVTVIAS